MFEIGIRGKTHDPQVTGARIVPTGGHTTLDFTKPFLPETIARVQDLTFLAPGIRRTLNQIRGYGYIHLLRVAEESLLSTMPAAKAAANDDEIIQVRDSRAMRISLLRTVCAACQDGFGARCGVIGSVEEMTRIVSTCHPLATALLVLQIALMKQRHAAESRETAHELDPTFAELITHPEMQPDTEVARATLMVKAFALTETPAGIAEAIDIYGRLALYIGAGIEQQAQIDVVSLRRTTGHALTSEERAAVIGTQRTAMRRAYLSAGMTHPAFLDAVAAIAPCERGTVEATARAFA